MELEEYFNTRGSYKRARHILNQLIQEFKEANFLLYFIMAND